MTALVQLHVYSGRPDPVWAISDADLQHLRGTLRGKRASDAPMRSGLGYRGFSVLPAGGQEEAPQGIFEDEVGKAIDEGGERVTGQLESEEFLLWTGMSHLEDALVDHVRIQMAADSLLTEDDVEKDDAVATAACPPNGGPDAPTYNPGYWNNDANRRRNNNCYNYANNKVTNTFAQPGRGSGQMLSRLACGGNRGAQAAATRDGLVAVPNFKQSIPKGWFTALVVWPGNDYHWYRQDKNGCWSHKPGRTKAIHVDHRGARITDPKTCDRGPYTAFCSYMITRKGVRIA